MNNKGQMEMVGGLIMLAIAVIVGAILLQGSAQNIDSVVNTVTVTNQTIDTPVNLTAYSVTGYKSISSVVVVNASNGAAIGATNYTVANNQIVNGVLVATITPDAAVGYRSPADWNISYVGEPTAYADSGGRAMSNLIIIMMALALAAVGIGFAVKSYISD